MTKLQIFNTESRVMESVQPLVGNKIRMYTCGPTIYNFAHIGNFRTYVFEDLLRRTLKYFGFEVEQVMNITDLDDKTIKGAISQNISLKEYTEPFKIAFFEDLQTLGIEKVEHYPAATEYIAAMIQMIQTLLDKGFAYRSQNGSIYFSIHKFPSYGRLSHFHLEDLKENASGDNEADEYTKEDMRDFVLWKAYDPTRDGNIFWESPFGKGRPGWHIECSAMATQLLGPSIDIHCGGVDNCFPHHENEIAQSESASQSRFVKHWIHVEHLLVDHKKMSKSAGNFYTLRDLIQKGYTGTQVRYLLLSTHYRTQLNFTLEGLVSARNSLQRISDFIIRLKEVIKEGAPIATALIERAKLQFQEALADDLNISVALAVLFEMIRQIHIWIDEDRLTKEDQGQILAFLEECDSVLQILPLKNEAKIPEEMEILLSQRQQARKEKNWKLSDEIRDQLLAKGFIIEDTPHGARLKRKQ